jgi:GNAT superfamily N-acetyltransferase
MQSVLHALGLRNGQNVDHRPRAVGRTDAHSPVGLVDDLPSEDRTPEVGHSRAAEQTGQLLPQGVDTPGVLMLVAETPEGMGVGHLWLALEREAGNGGGAWIYDIEIVPEQRGRGYGRALLGAAEERAARHGADSIGLNVFGTNLVARDLYQSAGYSVATMQLRKVLHSAAEGGEDG